MKVRAMNALKGRHCAQCGKPGGTSIRFGGVK